MGVFGRVMRACAMLALCCCSQMWAGEASWPGFRGPDLDGKIEGRGTFRGKSNVALKTAWKVPLGSGYSGVVIGEGRAITAFANETHNLLGAFDAKSGKQLWTYELGPIYKGHDGSHDGPIATPYHHNGMVFMHDTSGALVAVEAASGKEVWRKMLPETMEVPPLFYGYGSSPMVYDNKLIMIVGGKDQAVVAFNPKTGDVLWKSGSERVIYQSVMPWTYKDQKVLLAPTGKYLFALNPDDGKPIWAWFHDGGGSPGSFTTLPIPLDENRIFMANKTNRSTVVKLGEVKAAQPAPTGEDAAPLEDPKPIYPLIDAEVVWEDMSIRKSYNIPILHDGYLYAHSTRFLTCVDPATGEAMWRSRPPGDGFFSMVDGHLIVLTKRGALHAIEASPEDYKPVAELNVFDDTAWTMPSFADGAVFVRSMTHMARVDVVDNVVVAANSDAATSDQKTSDFQVLLSELNGMMDAAKKEKRIKAFFEKHPNTPYIEDNGRVTFLYHGEAKDVALASEIFGARQERGMQRVKDTNLFYFVTEVPVNAMVHYHFIKDFEEPLLDPRNSHKSETQTFDKFMGFNMTPDTLPVSLLQMPKWESSLAQVGVKEAEAADLKLHDIDSQKLDGVEKVRVYTPRGYDESKSYRVLYVLNGKEVAERIHWSKLLPQVMSDQDDSAIVVFVGEGPNPNPAFGAFLAEELVPFIDGNYSTKSEASQRYLIGMGYPGDIALRVGLSNASVFGNLAISSPWIFDSSIAQLDGLLEKLEGAKPNVYVDWGTYDMRNSEENWDLRKYAKRVVEKLKKHEVPVTVKTFQNGTGYPAWRERSVPLLQHLLASNS